MLAGTKVSFRLTGDPGTDFDLWVWSSDVSAWVDGCTAETNWVPGCSSDSNELVEYTPSLRADLWVYVLVWSGSGGYTLSVSGAGNNRSGSAVSLGQYTVTAYACPEEADTRYFPDSSIRTKVRILKKDLETVVTVAIKEPLYRAIAMNGCGLINKNPQNYNHLVQREYWFSAKADYREVDQLMGAFGRFLTPYYSVAFLPANTQLKAGDRGYFIANGIRYEFRADDTGDLATKQIDFFLGTGQQAYAEAFQWGRKKVTLYKY